LEIADLICEIEHHRLLVLVLRVGHRKETSALAMEVFLSGDVETLELSLVLGNMLCPSACHP